MLRCPVCDSIRVVLVLNGAQKAFCGRCGSRWVQDGSRQSSVERRSRRGPSMDRPAPA